MLDLIENNALVVNHASSVSCPVCRDRNVYHSDDDARMKKLICELNPQQVATITPMEIMGKVPNTEDRYFVKCPDCNYFGTAKLDNPDIAKERCFECDYLIFGYKNSPCICGYYNTAVNPKEKPKWCPCL